MTRAATIRERIESALETVMDPELPPVRIVDLGVVEDVRISQDLVEVDLLPTFSGCPALDLIAIDVERAVSAVAGRRRVSIAFRRDIAWTTDRMNDRAREALSEFGVSGPGPRSVPIAIVGVTCPFCGSTDTQRESEFGPALCRDIRYCNACANPFEGFKPK